jgi:hypothetical protein
MCRRPPALAALALLLAAPTARTEGDMPRTKLNEKIVNISFTVARGKPVALGSLAGNKATVVVFLSFECPVSRSCAAVLADLSGRYGERVSFVGVNGDDEDPAEVERQARGLGIPFPVLKDVRHAAADALAAAVVPEAFVLDAGLVLRYRGRIDDSWSARLRRNPRPEHADLRDALDDVLAGRPVRTPATRAVGCPLVRESVAKASGPVTFYRDVLPVLQAHCQPCHRPGDVGPIPLLTYPQALRWAKDIKDLTGSRRMPPWKPAGGVRLQNDRRLSEKEIAALAAWADGGGPEGDPHDAPPRRTFTEGWQLGEPDLVLTVPDEMKLGPNGDDVFRVFVLPAKLAEDRHVIAAEVRPGNRRVVHHALVFFDRSGRGRALERKERERPREQAEADRGPGYPVAMGAGFRPEKVGDVGDLGAWAPGQRVRPLPEGAGYLLPRGEDVLLQIHYHRTGRAETDRTSVGLYFAKKPVRRAFQALVLSAPFLHIPAGESAFRVRGAIEVEQDCRLHALLPHLHALGKEVKVTLTPPGGRPRTLLEIKDWDWRWQETYFLEEPLALKAGTRLRVEAVYDNSAGNPANPSRPPRPVVFGEQADDEMCNVFLGLTSERPGPIPARFADPGDP